MKRQRNNDAIEICKRCIEVQWWFIYYALRDDYCRFTWLEAILDSDEFNNIAKLGRGIPETAHRPFDRPSPRFQVAILTREAGAHPEVGSPVGRE